jgi:ABC-2 type transport system permease protein
MDFFAVVGFVSLPLFFASNALAPLEVMDLWLRWLAQINPMTYAISSVRELLLVGVDWGLIGSMSGVLLAFDAAMVAICLWETSRILD